MEPTKIRNTTKISSLNVDVVTPADNTAARPPSTARRPPDDAFDAELAQARPVAHAAEVLVRKPDHQVAFGNEWYRPIRARPGEVIRFDFPKDRLEEFVRSQFNGGLPNYQGEQTWTAKVGFSIDGGPAQYYWCARRHSAPNEPAAGHQINSVNFTVPQGATRVNYWLETSGVIPETGWHTGYFSNNGANFDIRIAPLKSPEPLTKGVFDKLLSNISPAVIQPLDDNFPVARPPVFKPNVPNLFFQEGAEVQQGSIHAGQSLRIFYDVDRIPKASTQTREIYAYISADGQPPVKLKVRNFGAAPEELEYRVPAGTANLELWFEGLSLHGGPDPHSGWVESRWDSRGFGQNWNFAVE